jgi:hypothetical protein
VAVGWRASYLERFTKLYYYVDEVKDDEMGAICSTHGRDDKCVQNFG